MGKTWAVLVEAMIGVLIWSAPVLADCESDDDCDWEEKCVQGECVPCVPDCAGKECGDDGCGDSCGICPPGIQCLANLCYCEPDCAGKQCGQDFCGGYCGNGNPVTLGCPDSAPLCDPISYTCADECVPDCSTIECGPDGCGGSCGFCPCDSCDPVEVECSNGICQEPYLCECDCIFDCFDTCPEGDQACYQICVNSATIEGQMAYSSLINCMDDKGYFDCPENDNSCLDAALEACGPEYQACFGDPCQPQCGGKECGPDGCGGSCGDCDPGAQCHEGECAVEDTCEDQCEEGSAGCAGNEAWKCAASGRGCLARVYQECRGDEVCQWGQCVADPAGDEGDEGDEVDGDGDAASEASDGAGPGTFEAVDNQGDGGGGCAKKGAGATPLVPALLFGLALILTAIGRRRRANVE